MTPVYLDHFSTTPCDAAVLAAMVPYFDESFGNPHAVAHAPGRHAFRVFEAAREDIAALIGATGAGITLTSGATEANNLALFGVAEAAKGPRREIVISAIEHDSVSRPAAALAQRGFTLRVLPVSPAGYVRLEDAAAVIGENTLLVSVIAASHELGTLQPIRDIAALARKNGALMHSDATQAAGKIPLDVEALGVDLLSFCAHKIYGPAGIGALWVRQKPPVMLQPQLLGGGQQLFRAGTIPLPLAVGFAAACRLALARLPIEGPRLRALADSLLTALQTDGTGVVAHSRSDIPGLLNIRFPGIAAEELMADFSGALYMSSGAACASASRKPSPVLQAVGLDDAAIAGSLRLSLGHSSTPENISAAAQLLAEAVTRRRASTAS